MKFRHFNIFKSVCDEASMTKAAKLLFVSQPSVSQAIRELEDHYEVKLFDRISRKLYLTQAGEELYKYASHILSMNMELEGRMKDLNQSYTIRLGATVTIGTYSLAPWVSEFAKLHPEGKIRMKIMNTKEIQNQLLKSELDIALVEGMIDSESLVIRPFMKDELVVIGAKGNPVNRTIKIMKNLEDYEFLIREEGSGSRKMFLDNVYSKSIPINIVAELNSNEAIKNGVLNNLGLGVLSRSAISEYDNVEIIEIEDLEMIRDYSIVYHKDKLLSKGLEYFIDYLS